MKDRTARAMSAAFYEKTNTLLGTTGADALTAKDVAISEAASATAANAAAQLARQATEGARDEALAFGSAEHFESWTLADAASFADGDTAVVLASDTGQHTSVAGDFGADGGNTPNAGYYRYSDSVASLVRVGALESWLTAANAELADAAISAIKAPDTGIRPGALVYDPFTKKMLLGFNALGDAQLNGVEFTRAIPDANGDVHIIGDGVRGLLTIHVETGQIGVGSFTDETVARLSARLGDAPSGGVSAGSPTLMDTKIDAMNDTGQSLTNGAGAERTKQTSPTLTNQPPPFSLMFNTGTRGRMSNVLSGSTLTSLVPAIEQEDAAGGNGETQGCGAMHQLYGANIARGVNRYGFFRSHGSNGQRIDQINSGTQPFANGLIEVQRLIALAAARGFTVTIPDIAITQGEADRAAGTAKATYKTLMRGLLDAYNANWLPEIRAQSGHSSDPALKLLIHQLAAAANGLYGASDIAVAHYELARDESDMWLIGPSYVYETLAEPGMPIVDHIHRPARSYRLMGAYRAKARDRLRAGGSFAPMMPTAINRVGDTITISLGNAIGNLVIDTATLPENTTYLKGFEYSGGVTVTNVAVSGKTLTLTLSSAAAGTLRYAYTAIAGITGRPSAWGNIRDSDAVPCLPDPTRLLWNWLPTFEETIP